MAETRRRSAAVNLQYMYMGALCGNHAVMEALGLPHSNGGSEAATQCQHAVL